MDIVPLQPAPEEELRERLPLVMGAFLLLPALGALGAVVAPGSAFDVGVLALTGLLTGTAAGSLAVWKEEDWPMIWALAGGAALVAAAMTLGLGSMVAFSAYLQDPCSGPCWIW